MIRKKLSITNYEELINIFGEQDKYLRETEKKHKVNIFYHQDKDTSNYNVEITGKNKAVNEASLEINTRRQRIAQKTEELFFLKKERTLEPDSLYSTPTGKQIVPLSHNQKAYVDSIFKNDLVIGIGPAGSGKTFLAVACALSALDSGTVERIVITRPVVEAGEKLGFLPGDLYEKVNPYLKPIMDAFHIMLGAEILYRYRETGVIEIVPLAYMRGRTLDDAFMILDEAQNTSPQQMKMFLTRIGSKSQAVVTGDITQIDLENKRQSGLVLIQKILHKVQGVKFIRFNEKDVVRHKLVRDIIRAYEYWENHSDK